MEEVCPVKTREIKLRHTDLCTIVEESDYISLNLGLYLWRHQKGKCGVVYAKTYVKGKTVLLHRLIMGIVDSPRSVLVDHIDHDGLNNTKANLRITNDSGNSRNSRKQKQSSSKFGSRFKGVQKDTYNRRKVWRAEIICNRKRKYLGHFLSEVEAAQAYNKAATELFGGFAYLNVILDKETASAQDIQQAGKSPIAIRTST